MHGSKWPIMYVYSKAYGESIAIFTTVSYYATMHPLIMLCGSVYFYVK